MPHVISFDKTRAALAAHDAHDGTWPTIQALPDLDNDGALAWFRENDHLARAVGRAYGEDTAYINSPDTCELCIRPGPWLRGMIANPMTVSDDQMAKLTEWRERHGLAYVRLVG